ncbi:MAG: hypothetical protein RR642_16835, partial [Solibacillus sp.]
GQITFLNCYEYWNIKNAQYVAIAESVWIEQLSEMERAFILNEQIQCERGLVLPASFIQDISQIPTSYVHNNQVVLQRSMWEKLSKPCKEQLLTSMVYEWWDKGDCEDIPDCLPAFLKPVANKFGIHQGANCLAAVLFAISEGKQQWFIHEWVQQRTFIEKLNDYHYEIVATEKLQKDDVVAWVDEKDVIQHAAYYIGQNLFFNKHGQTIFNPWKLLAKGQLYNEWATFKPVVYRRSSYKSNT